MKRSIMLLCVMSWLCFANDTNPTKETRIIENSDRVILVNPNVEKEIIIKENVELLIDDSIKEVKESANSVVTKRLEQGMIDAFNNVYSVSKKHNVSMRKAALILGISRVADVIKLLN